jgi:hypothetical protein
LAGTVGGAHMTTNYVPLPRYGHDNPGLRRHFHRPATALCRLGKKFPTEIGTVDRDNCGPWVF